MENLGHLRKKKKKKLTTTKIGDPGGKVFNQYQLLGVKEIDNMYTRGATMRRSPKQEWLFRWRLIIWTLQTLHKKSNFSRIEESHCRTQAVTLEELDRALTHQQDWYVLLCAKRNRLSTHGALQNYIHWLLVLFTDVLRLSTYDRHESVWRCHYSGTLQCL